MDAKGKLVINYYIVPHFNMLIVSILKNIYFQAYIRISPQLA